MAVFYKTIQVILKNKDVISLKDCLINYPEIDKIIIENNYYKYIIPNSLTLQEGFRLRPAILSKYAPQSPI